MCCVGPGVLPLASACESKERMSDQLRSPPSNGCEFCGSAEGKCCQSFEVTTPDGQESVIHISCTGARAMQFCNCRGCGKYMTARTSKSGGGPILDIRQLRDHCAACTKCNDVRTKPFQDRILHFPAAIGPDTNSLALLAVLVWENFRKMLLADDETGLSCIFFAAFLNALG